MPREIINRRMNIVAEDGEGYVDVLEPSDYATNTKAGVFRTSNEYGTSVSAAGLLSAATRTVATYNRASEGLFISKGTLENVLESLICRKLIPNPVPGATYTGRVNIVVDSDGTTHLSLVTP